MTRTPLSRSKGQRSRSPGRFIHRGLNAWGRSSGDRENVLGVGKLLLHCVCSAALKALGQPRGRRGAGAYRVATHTACSTSCAIRRAPTSTAMTNNTWAKPLLYTCIIASYITMQFQTDLLTMSFIIKIWNTTIVYISFRFNQIVSILDFTEAKDDRVEMVMTTAAIRHVKYAKLQSSLTNQHPAFFTGRDVLPVAQPTQSKHWRKYRIPRNCSPQTHQGVFCRLWPLKALGYLGEDCHAPRQPLMPVLHVTLLNNDHLK